MLLLLLAAVVGRHAWTERWLTQMAERYDEGVRLHEHEQMASTRAVSELCVCVCGRMATAVNCMQMKTVGHVIAFVYAHARALLSIGRQVKNDGWCQALSYPTERIR